MREQVSDPQVEPSEGNQLTTADMAEVQATSGDVQPVNGPERPVEGGRDRPPQTGAQGPTEKPTPLFEEAESGAFRSRWTTVQAEFVDDPRHAVEAADHLVAEAIQRLAQVFAAEREGLEKQWSGGGDASTEDLRVAFHRYRSFCDRLLAA